MEKSDIEEKIRQFFVGELGISPDVTPSTPLFSSSLLDSINLLKVVDFIESDFKLGISPFDVNLETFDRIDSIATFIQSKQ